MHPKAELALYAAKNWHRWGKYATVRFCEKRGIPLKLLGLAVALHQLHSTK